MEECTFKPKVNNVPRKFGSAQLYLQNNVHDRLSTPRAARGKSIKTKMSMILITRSSRKQNQL